MGSPARPVRETLLSGSHTNPIHAHAQYATGKNNSIQHANTGLTIDTVLSNLLDNPDRTFSYVEQAFFQRWVQDASEQQLTDMQKVVASGQMTFINGAWAMHDEASPSYVDMIDNTALGHRLISEQFGASALPTVTWQIDPFGHSATQATATSSALAGFNALYFGRIDYQDKANRLATNSTETVWRPSPSTTTNTQTFAGHLVNGYGPPSGLCWDEVGCSNTEPIQDDPLLEDYNVPYFLNLTLSMAREYAGYVKGEADGTVHVLWPMGSDFQYTNARGWYKNMDKLIHWVNANTPQHKVNLLYSNPATYTTAKLAQNITWPLKTDDFMPYADGPHAMWSGYFTSRSALKHYVRTTSNVHQTARQMQFAALRPTDMGPSNPLYRLERAMGVTQHHDGVSGTSKQHVAYDYARRLAWGREDAAAAAAVALAALTGTTAGAPLFAACDLANATICAPLTSGGTANVSLTAWNPRGQALPTANFRVPVAVGGSGAVKSFAVTDAATGLALTAQLLPASASDLALRTEYYGEPLPALGNLSWLCWQGTLPAAGFATFILTPTLSAAAAPATIHSRLELRSSSNNSISNRLLTLTFDAEGLLSSYASNATSSGTPLPLTQSWGYYNSSIGTNAPNDNTTDPQQPSGAYIFRTNTSTLFPLPGDPTQVVYVTGPVVSEVRTGIVGGAGEPSAPPGWITQVTRLWAGEGSLVDVEWTVGPIPNGAAPSGKEVVTRYAVSGLATNGTWATDSNCREMQPRVRNARWSWNYTAVEPIAGNYVPVNCRITTAGAAATGEGGSDSGGGTPQVLSIAVDRSMGGGSLEDGSVELMVQRRLQQDDRRGVNEPLNEPGLTVGGHGLIVRGVHRVSLGAPGGAPAVGKEALQSQMFPPALFFTGGSASASSSSSGAVVSSWSSLTAPLPDSIHLLTVQALGPNALLLRLAHLFETGEDAALSKPVQLGLSGLFTGTTLSGCVEVSARTHSFCCCCC